MREILVCEKCLRWESYGPVEHCPNCPDILRRHVIPDDMDAYIPLIDILERMVIAPSAPTA